MSVIRFIIVLLSIGPVALAGTIAGNVRDTAGQPVAGATVAIVGMDRTAVTAADGAFSFEVPDGLYRVRITRTGFQALERRVRTGETIGAALMPAVAETIVVSAIRADAETPVTKTDLPRAEIEQRYSGQDVPLLVRDEPSVTAYAESGVGGAGYSYFSFRGISPTRINFTLDGVPLSDSEDMGVYFVDFPDLSRSLESIQIQRGVGTSTFGTAALGGSVNLESIALSPEKKTEAMLAGGSFGNRQASVGLQSGTLAGGQSFYTRVSYLENGGYRDNSATRQRNIFFSGATPLGEGQLKLTGFTGHEDQQSSYYAVDEATLETNPRFNPLRPEEKDSFGYDLAQLQYIRPLGAASHMTASAYYQRGYGWFRLFKSNTDQLRQYGLDGMLLGSIFTFSQTRGPLTTNYGVHVNRFQRDHTRDNMSTDVRDYSNYGVKGEENAFAKLSYDAGRVHLYGDAQVRHATFDYHGGVDIPSASWTSFNPKLGARYDVASGSSLYASAGVSTREPTRNDLFLGEDNPSVAHDLHAVRPERLVDIEAGWNFRSTRASIDANVYAMQFHNEIAATGEQSEIGLSLRRNVDRSYRRGVELDAAFSPGDVLRFRTTANFSRNRINRWTQFYDVYDSEGSWIASKPVTYNNVRPLLTPEVVVAQTIEYMPLRALTLGVTGRYVDESYLDNTDSEALATPSFFVMDAMFRLQLSRWIRTGNPTLTVQVNNVSNRDRLWASGYSYPFITRGAAGQETFDGVAYYYPQATRNVVVLLDVKL